MCRNEKFEKIIEKYNTNQDSAKFYIESPWNDTDWYFKNEGINLLAQ